MEDLLIPAKLYVLQNELEQLQAAQEASYKVTDSACLPSLKAGKINYARLIVACVVNILLLQTSINLKSQAMVYLYHQLVLIVELLK